MAKLRRTGNKNAQCGPQKRTHYTCKALQVCRREPRPATGETRVRTKKMMKKKMKMKRIARLTHLIVLLFFIIPLSSWRIGPPSPRRKDQMSLGSVAQEEKDLNLSPLHVEEADSLTVSLGSCVPDAVDAVFGVTQTEKQNEERFHALHPLRTACRTQEGVSQP